ncbi:hypothetical protein C8T65DRAFT_102019 [Cerioporus squamosus]|nr:hypothetical protein C8T65DRAFT_102019 [Cerioporus squamosus]
MDPSPRLWSRDVTITEGALDPVWRALTTAEEQTWLVISFIETYLKRSIIDVAILTMFIGLFTILAAGAAYVLISKGSKRKSTVFMLVAIVAMWAATVAYWIATLLAETETYTILRTFSMQTYARLNDLDDCMRTLSGSSLASARCQPEQSVSVPERATTAYEIQDCTGTVGPNGQCYHGGFDGLVACLGALAGKQGHPLYLHTNALVHHGNRHDGYEGCVHASEPLHSV